MKKVMLLMMMLLVSVPVFADNFDYGDFMQKLDRVVPKVETRRQYEARQPTIRYEVYEEEKEDYETPPPTAYQSPVYQRYMQQVEKSQNQIERQLDKSSDWLVPLLIVGLAVLAGDGFAIWYLHQKLLDDFNYDILSTGKLFLFGVQTLPLIVLLFKSAYKLTALDIVFGLGFVGAIMAVYFYMDKRNTSLKYAVILLFVRLIASIFIAVVAVIIVAIFVLWLMSLGGDDSRREKEITPEKMVAIKRILNR